MTLTISQLNEYIRRTVQMDPMLHNISLRGEISNLKFHQTGTVFFSLKDEQATIPCVMYASDVDNLQVSPFNGMRVTALGSVGMYVRGGQLQFYVSSLAVDGLGVLYERLMALKAKLSGEGLFDPERKKRIPPYPQCVAVVTSPTGAVIHDILQVSSRRNPFLHILIFPVHVQGIHAPEEVAQAIYTLEKMEDIDVLIVARGGGSMEDLWTFNEECVVRAVAECRKPIVSAIGHETDVTLCDLAADLRVPTPSAAAECVTPLRSEMVNELYRAHQVLNREMENCLDGKKVQLELFRNRLEMHNPRNRMVLMKNQLDFMRNQLIQVSEQKLKQGQERLKQRKTELDILNPRRILSKGYAIVMGTTKTISSVQQIADGEKIQIQLLDGTIQAVVQKIVAGDEYGA